MTASRGFPASAGETAGLELRGAFTPSRGGLFFYRCRRISGGKYVLRM